jgi:preprotein translocase subunit YajC
MTYVVLAQETTTSALPTVIFLGLMVAVFWLFIIRPQRKRSRDQRELADSLTVGQKVRTIGGIEGVVVSIEEKGVVLRVEEGKIRVTKRAIGTSIGGDED